MGGAELPTSRPLTVTVRVSPASTRRRTSPIWLRNSFYGIVAICLR